MANSSMSEGVKEHHYRIEGIKVRSLIKNRSNFGESRSHNSWSNLPGDVLGELMKSLSLADQIRLRCVCKSFLELPLCQDSPINRLPWLGTYDNSKADGFVCKLFDPMHKEPYEILQITGPREDSFCPDYVVFKHGWLLFLKESGGYRTELFLFCPYTKEIVVLPHMDHGERRSSRANVTFTLDPNSHEFEVFAVYVGFRGLRYLYSYRSYDKEWTSKRFFTPFMFGRILTEFLYHRGHLYLRDSDGDFAAYNVRQQKWSRSYHWPPEDRRQNLKYHLVASEGILLVVLLTGSVQYFVGKIMELNYSEPEINLVPLNVQEENQARFLESAFVLPKFTGEVQFVDNKIFYSTAVEGGHNWRFYDYNELKDHDFGGTELEYFVPQEEEKHTAAFWIESPNHVLKPFLHSVGNFFDISKGIRL